MNQPDNNPGVPGTLEDDRRSKPGVFARIGRTLMGNAGGHSDGASWSEVHIAGGDADFALEPAPTGAGTDRAHGAQTKSGEAERGLHQDQEQPPDRDANDRADAVRCAPADDEPDPDGITRRPLSEVLYRPRSGLKRTVQLTCSAEPAEREFIDQAAREAKRSRSAYLMDAALAFAHAYLPDQRPSGIPPLPSPQATQDLMVRFGKMQREFHRIGINLNQITRAAHMGLLSDRADEVLDELDAAARAARRALQHTIAGCRHGA
ncbi:plasmid mobilization relaxosome protein MobC [Streptomyces polygonati]|uniref:Plasmid mobilization relaxosome protein MobC n=1 Tax=Streptomyces polygonati TaxID=1617087 RepID=A0ABV8HR52_9ACTN